MTPQPLYRALMVALAAGTLAACGGGGGGGGDAVSTGGTSSITSVGTVTGFGSLYVNGVKYETDSTLYSVDDDDDDLEDQSGDDSSMRLGMKVRVRGEINDDGRTGRADSVEYDDDIEGPIQNLSRDLTAGTATFDIFGLEIFADGSTNFDGSSSLASLDNDQVFEVSGNFDGNRLVATFMDPQDPTENEFEVKGTVTAYDAFVEVTIELINGASLTRPIDPNAIVELDGDPIGDFVELKLNAAGDVIKIENDDEDLLDQNDDGNEIEISGVLTDGASTDFELNGVPLVFTTGTEYKPTSLESNLAAGLFVKVHGRRDGDNLIVREIETEEGEIEIDAPVESVVFSDAKTGTITLDVGAGETIDVQTDSGTAFKDDSSLDLDDDDSFNLDELTRGQFLQIEAYLDDAGDLVATEVEREADPDDVEIRAPLEGKQDFVSVTVLGVTWSVANGVTEYRLEDAVIDATTFFTTADVGTPIKLRDDEVADGTADELEIRND